ncbi:FMN reductase [Aminobacter aganoensis]|uniref:FMN reductase n=1 Tax=Aminobacter aganoensis TaxID=83264 RepID=A0A7X0FCT7_9HYPH|nr:FMN reductase [Aminobacter aganoensis]MBB6357277.1 FMN reductase [Aminobacter aganoensis]
MSAKLVLGISGNISRPSKTRTFVEHIAGQVALRSNGVSHIFDIEDLGPSLGQARQLKELEPTAHNLVERIAAADVLVVGSPTYKGSYTGLFKHFFDLLDPAALRGKPVILTATGGGERHSLIVEHQLRPLFGFFEALTMPTAIYATNRDFADGILVSETIRARAQQAVAEACRAIGIPENVSLAA